ncbi:MAG: hypothetical protein AM326_11795 [Candidatus Thorarchaeota archaeon SMTZ-45]|nr:MAG: hypothetical protein AM326_11795 [Candidatus Thorarchaeota archaeon SMTZ-45]KXH72382.1 MAG: hypothetical protein AM325_14330 [Candidatus Thorarchaeota archaeon SMTZ1-45]
MSLRDRIPDQLKIGKEVIAITIDDDIAVYPTSDYILLEISHKAGKVNILKVANTLRGLVKDDNLMVAVRGFGFKGIGLAVRVAHELKVRETNFKYEMTFDTFDATDPKTDRPVTSVQIIVMPPE